MAHDAQCNTDDVVAAIAVAAACDVRTVYKFLAGGRVRGRVAARLAHALQEHAPALRRGGMPGGSP